VVSLSGDGGFTMMLGDFLTLRQMGIPVKVVVFNNGTLGFVELEMKAGGFLDTGCDLQNPNFAAMAEAMGGMGIRVEAPHDLRAALAAVRGRRAAPTDRGPALPAPLAPDAPALIDAVCARQELIMPPKTTLAEAGSFGLFMLKAGMSGRAGGLGDLGKGNFRR